MRPLELGYAEHCFQGLSPCGDGMASSRHRNVLRLMLADGIGHGQHAHGVVTQLKQQFQWICNRSQDLISIGECLQELHEQLHRSLDNRQAAVAMLDVDADTGEISGLSVGNVSAHHLGDGRTFSFPSFNGMVGGRMPGRLPLSVHRSTGHSLLVLHSDGVSTRDLLPYLQSLSQAGGRRHRRAQPIAEQVIQRFGKPNDDASCAVLLLTQEQAP